MRIDWEQERLRRLRRDDEFMAQLRADHRHELRVTIAGGVAGFAVVLLVVVGAFATWGDAVPYDIGMGLSLLAIALVLGGVVLAHLIDDRRRRSNEPSPAEPSPDLTSDRSRWRVQGFLLPQVTGKTEDVPYAPMFLDSELEARQACTQLYRSHAPGMVRVEIERIR